MRSAERDRRFDIIVGRVLAIGITSSSLCLAAGLLLSAAGLAPIAGVVLSAGLLMLMATPAARIALNAIVYARQREWLFAALTIVVVAELVISVFLTAAG